MHRTDGRIGKGLGVKPRRVLIVPKTNRVLCWLRHSLLHRDESREVGRIVIQIMAVFAVVLLRYRISIVVEILVSQFSVAILEQEVGARYQTLNDGGYRVGFFFCVEFASPALHETESQKQSDV